MEKSDLEKGVRAAKLTPAEDRELVALYLKEGEFKDGYLSVANKQNNKEKAE